MAKEVKASEKELDEIVQEANQELGGSVSTGATLNSIEAAQTIKFNKLEVARRELVKKYREEEKFPVTISPFYAPYLGRVVRVSVNGIVVDIPADGKSYKINKTHADHVLAKIKRIDAMIQRQKRAADVTKNFENTPGELHL